MNRANYIYQLVGKIIDKKAKKKKDRTTFYQLAVVIEDKAVSKINVFSDSCQQEIWPAIEANSYIGKEYLFCCKNYMGHYYLMDWKILEKNQENHGSN